ncbi:NAD-dependent epimerase/dehydratase family protein [Streptomyces sp. NPDC008001]|uniref:NAD-dependent epimerase/dehydratase family protein n=1 Tax=Streptomyces sp. NPDC008001 TaxID=3364804 RepID=UPI0036E7CDB4
MTGPDHVLVTGGSGFLGREICRLLIARGTETHSLARRPSTALARLGVRQHQGDLADPVAVARAVAACDAVVHTAALTGVAGPPGPYWTTNVDGTRNVLAACRTHHIPTLVHTSTASVVFRPGGLHHADESTPYPGRHLAAYPRTKARSEQLVLAADGPRTATCVLRPHIIWGPEDPHFLPALLRAAIGRHLFMPGDGTHLLDTTHVRTAAHAHLLALDRLHHRRMPGGRAYFISQDEPRPLRTFVTLLLAAAGVAATWHTLPTGAVRAAATACDVLTPVLRRTGTHRLSRFLVAELTSPHWFDIAAAKRDLGFVPPIGFAEGIGELYDARRRS